MSEKLTFSAYRLQRLSWKGMARTILSVKRKAKQDFNEKASEYILEIQSGQLTVYELGLQGERQEIHSGQLSEKEQATVLASRKYKDEHYVYHIMEEVTG